MKQDDVNPHGRWPNEPNICEGKHDCKALMPPSLHPLAPIKGDINIANTMGRRRLVSETRSDD
eukprot:1009461-Pelagomonas_calceolata.AAC.2